MFSVVIPVCSLVPESVPYRVEALKYAVKHMYKDQEVIVVEQSLDNKTYFNIPGIKKIDLNYPVFNKGWCINVGVAHASNEYIVIADCDILGEISWRAAHEWMERNNYKWSFFWSRIIYTTNSQRDRILSGWRDLRCKHDTPRPGYSEGGLVCFRRAYFDKIGGCNECFEELGGPDNELIIRAKVFQDGYPMFPLLIYHLWHPQRPKKLRLSRLENIKLLRKTRRNPEKMIEWLKKQPKEIRYPLPGRRLR